MTALSFALILIAAMTAQTTLVLSVTSSRIKASEARLDQKIDQKVDGLEAVMTAKLETVDHRLGALEGDMLLVKQHMLGTPSSKS